MTVEELITILEDLEPTAPVRIAHNPESWPLAFEVAGVSVLDPYEDHEGMDADEASVVWLVSGDHPEGSAYAPSDLGAIVRTA